MDQPPVQEGEFASFPGVRVSTHRRYNRQWLRGNNYFFSLVGRDRGTRMVVFGFYDIMWPRNLNWKLSINTSSIIGYFIWYQYDIKVMDVNVIFDVIFIIQILCDHFQVEQQDLRAKWEHMQRVAAIEYRHLTLQAFLWKVVASYRDVTPIKAEVMARALVVPLTTSGTTVYFPLRPTYVKG